MSSLIHALARLSEQGMLDKLREKVAIGQGYKKVEGKGLGVGNCTKDFEKNVPGCPPTARDIIKVLKQELGSDS
ncbi:MAG TPA: hypothetical protein DCG84_05685 [Peptococcaceae bacterium]|nr:hypothetical protein [Peptococcaceae bacterium]